MGEHKQPDLTNAVRIWMAKSILSGRFKLGLKKGQFVVRIQFQSLEKGLMNSVFCQNSSDHIILRPYKM